ncbi:MAG: hypothetical protein ACR2P0_12735, partial [Acidimicrobiales bacterium]
MATVDVVDRGAQAMDRLHAALDEVAGLDPAFLPIDDLNTFAIETLRAETRLQGIKAGALAEAEAAALSVRCGRERSLTSHLAKQLRLNPRNVGPDRTFAIWLRDFHPLGDALTAGTVSRHHLAELKAVDNTRIHGLMVRDQHLFIEWAEKLQWADWSFALGYWLNAADPDGEDTDPANPKYGMSCRTLKNGDVTVSMHMDPVTGDAFLTMHDREAEKL